MFFNHYHSIEELQCALDEIKKNEKDISMIAMVA
jgi:hypothetical protein